MLLRDVIFSVGKYACNEMPMFRSRRSCGDAMCLICVSASLSRCCIYISLDCNYGKRI